MKSSETVVCLRGHLREVFYDANGRVIDTIDLIPGGPVVGLCIPIGQWHTALVLEGRFGLRGVRCVEMTLKKE